jgi:hypothetical protein
LLFNFGLREVDRLPQGAGQPFGIGKPSSSTWSEEDDTEGLDRADVALEVVLVVVLVDVESVPRSFWEDEAEIVRLR